MTPERPKLLVLKGASRDRGGQLETLKSAFDVVEVENISEARELLRGGGEGYILGPSTDEAIQRSMLAGAASTLLEHVGEGLGIVDGSGELVWADDRLQQLDERTRTSFTERCLQAIGLFDRSVGAAGRPQSMRFSFASGASHYELVVSPAGEQRERGAIATAVGVLWDVTASRRLQAKIDAIDAAGSELMRIDASSMSKLNMAQRLKLLEQKIVHYVNDLLNFDHFEIRLLDRETNQLELVIAVGISPLKIGEVIFAEPEGNGISGFVAASGRSYICNDVQRDPLYREGLDDAASSLTVPLRLHDQVIGVFNIESNSAAAFDENDRQFAEIFGRYIALATNILDLLAVERFTTNEQISANVLGELNEPLDRIAEEVAALRSAASDEAQVRQRIDDILGAASSIRSRIESCAAGPRTILGAEQELRRHEKDPLIAGRRILIADNERAIREALGRILDQRGAEVTVRENGLETIAELERVAESGARMFDLVVSDIKMPDRNGYEVFRKAKSISTELPVILMTGFGYDPHHSIVRASQEGLESFLFKPFKASQLIEAVQKALNPEQRERAGQGDDRSATSTRQSPS